MMYTQSSQTSTSSSPANANSGQGLTAQNQAQQAANFIRYVTGSTSPSELLNRGNYNNIFTKYVSAKDAVSQKQAQAVLTSYLSSLRTYAAQSSVGISNLYYILSKRLPLNSGTSSNGQANQTSQALNEFNMATWRLYNPDLSQNSQWANSISTATPATVQKEMAILLAEINYQMYLSRQDQERLLMTNTILLLQNARSQAPDSDVSLSDDSPSIPAPKS